MQDIFKVQEIEDPNTKKLRPETWDDPVPQKIVESYIKVINQLAVIKKFSFPRKTLIPNFKRVQIHGFCDASERAYGACIYARSTNNEGETRCELLC